MTSEHESGSSRLEGILAKYLQRVETGEPVERDELLRQHPEFEDGLREFFADDSQWKRVARAADSEVSPRASSEVEIAPTFDSEAPPGSPEVITQRVGYFGDYELLEEIARGGMDAVYKARQVNLDRTVALKTILAGQLAGEDEVRRFFQEGKSAANLEHPGIVPTYEIDSTKDSISFRWPTLMVQVWPSFWPTGRCRRAKRRKWSGKWLKRSLTLTRAA